jgi:DNA polymerase elongation subunit (family B)
MAKTRKLIGVLDFETDPFLFDRAPKPFCCELYFGEKESGNAVFWGKHCARELAEHLRDLDDCLIYAHNGGKFDFHFLLEFLDTGEIKIINGRIAQVYIGACELRDSFLIIPFALGKYKKTEIKYDIFEEDVRNKPANKSAILKYLHDDCRFTLELIQGFRKHTGHALTIGSAAFASMRRLNVPLEKQDEWHDERFRPYFFGGRVQVFEPGIIQEPVHVLDINSAYPYAMQFEHAHGKGYLESANEKIHDQSFVQLEAESLGAFPSRDTKTGRLEFPNDQRIREFLITGWEYNTAKKLKLLGRYHIISVLTPQKTINFKSFVEHHNAERDKAKLAHDEINSLAHKTLSNSGYGKLALNPRDFCDYALADVGDASLKMKGFQFDDDITDDLALWKKSAYHGDGFYDVATAASITGFVRAMLLKKIHGEGKKNRVYYCDTDCVMVSGEHDTQPKTKLGEWKYEGRADKGAFAGKKLYALRGEFGEKKEKIASKGCNLTYRQIQAIARGKTIVWRNQAPAFKIKGEPVFTERAIKMR